MSERKDLIGVIAAIVTPFTANDRLDLKGLEKIVGFLIENGVHGIMAVGGTGEFPHLLREEKKDVVSEIVRTVNNRIPVIAGTAACSTREVILLSQDAQESGATAVIATPPYYFRLPERSIIDYYKAVVKNIDIPLVVYNNPLYTGNTISPDGISELLKTNKIIGLKQSNTDIGQLVEVIRLSPKESNICTGIDSQFYPALGIGAKGIYSTAATVIPAQMVNLYNLFIEKKYPEALALHFRLQTLNKYLEYDPGYVAPCKEALNLLGLPGGSVRAPLPELTGEEKAGIKQALKEIGLLN